MNFIKNLWGKITHKANEAVTAVVEKTEAVVSNNRGDGYTSDALFS